MSAKVGGKGKPTPTRKEAEAARKQRLAAPRNRKEQAALARQRTRESRQNMRTAMQTGDDKYLPTRDQGPVKRYLRDYVDSRRTMGEFLLPVFFVAFIVFAFSAALQSSVQYVWLAIILLMVLDSIRLVRGAKKEVAEKFGADETKGLTMYVVMRAWQMRRVRLPKPQVKAGDEI